MNFTLRMNDPSGCSYIESRNPLGVDSKLKIKAYERSKEQHESLGFCTEDPDHSVDPSIYCFPTNCSNCGISCETRMHPLNIPYFKEVIVMSITCDRCGFKSNEVKCGGEIPPEGKIISLKIKSSEDLCRDILKSDSCQLKIPEISLELGTGTLGGRFTTIEGLLRQVLSELNEKCNFYKGDSAPTGSKDLFSRLTSQLSKVR